MQNKIISTQSTDHSFGYPSTVEELLTNLDSIFTHGGKHWFEERQIRYAKDCLYSDEVSLEEKKQIISALEKLGHFVHGNLSSENSYTYQKITLFKFGAPFRDLRGYLTQLIINARVKKLDESYDGFAKRNKLLAEIVFNCSYQLPDSSSVLRIMIPVPVKISTKDIYHISEDEKRSIDGSSRHTENALYHALIKTGFLPSTIPTLPSLIAESLKVPDITLNKINAVNIRMVSLYRSCDGCHDYATSHVVKGLLKQTIESEIQRAGFRIPQKTKGIGISIQMMFDWSPDGVDSENTYTRPLHAHTRTHLRPNFSADKTVFQRQGKMASSAEYLDTDRQYTLFISNGIIDRPFDEVRNYTLKLKQRLLPLSVEQDDLATALSEWEFSGEVERLDDWEKCDLCDTEHLAYHTIENQFNQNQMRVGSSCVTKFGGIRILDEEGNEVTGDDIQKRMSQVERLALNKAKAIQFLEKLDPSYAHFADSLKENGNLTIHEFSTLCELLGNDACEAHKELLRIIPLGGATVLKEMESETLNAFKPWAHVKIRSIINNILRQRDPHKFSKEEKDDIVGRQLVAIKEFDDSKDFVKTYERVGSFTPKQAALIVSLSKKCPVEHFDPQFLSVRGVNDNAIRTMKLYSLQCLLEVAKNKQVGIIQARIEALEAEQSSQESDGPVTRSRKRNAKFVIESDSEDDNELPPSPATPPQEKRAKVAPSPAKPLAYLKNSTRHAYKASNRQSRSDRCNRARKISTSLFNRETIPDRCDSIY